MNILVHDIETPKGCFLISIFMPSTGKWIDFLINQYQNDLYKLIKFLDDNSYYYFVGFNNLTFDGQVVEWIYRNYEKWENLSGKQIAALIWEYAQDVIDATNNGGFPPFREDQLSFKPIDVFKIQHFDNKNRRVGLKRLEYEMDAEDVREMKISHLKEDFTQEEVEDLIYYCHNDVLNTYRNYLYVIGEVDNTIYKGNNQIEIREAIFEKFGFNCLNHSNSKFGDEIIKKLYCEEANISYTNLPKKGTFRKFVEFKWGIPKYVSFKTPELQEFLQRMKAKKIGATEEFEESVKLFNQVHTFALGGIHNVIENKQYHSDDEYIIIDADVTGYYPRTIINNRFSPAHLNKDAFINAYSWVVNERESLKPQAKKDRKIKGIVGGYKEAGNAAYGKMGDMTNWMYDPQARLNVCIAGEMSILMLIEDQELAGNQCIMSNTDGATFLVKRTEIDKFYEICNKWCELTKYALEFAEFKHMWFLTVNDYLAVKMDGEVKRKGDFLIDTELHKNKSFRVIPLGLSEYFINGVEPEEFVNSFDNIFHFCGRSTAGDTYYHQYYDISDKCWKSLPKLIRYYVSKQGVKVMKIVKEDNDTNASDTNIRPAEYKKIICNNLMPSTHKEHLEKVDRQWYIDEIKKIIYRLNTGKKLKSVKVNPNQISLF